MFILGNNIFDQTILFPLQPLQSYLHHSFTRFKFKIFELLRGDRSLNIIILTRNSLLLCSVLDLINWQILLGYLVDYVSNIIIWRNCSITYCLLIFYVYAHIVFFKYASLFCSILR